MNIFITCSILLNVNDVKEEPFQTIVQRFILFYKLNKEFRRHVDLKVKLGRFVLTHFLI